MLSYAITIRINQWSNLMVLQVPQIPMDRTQPLPEDQGAICQTCVICGRVYRTCFPNSPAICHQQPPNWGTSPVRLIRPRQGTFFLFRMIQLCHLFISDGLCIVGIIGGRKQHATKTHRRISGGQKESPEPCKRAAEQTKRPQWPASQGEDVAIHWKTCGKYSKSESNIHEMGSEKDVPMELKLDSA